MKYFDKHIHKVYFLGIGGIGMSALARYFHLMGKEVKGYDRVETVVTKGLEEAGIEIFYVLDESHISEVDLVIYTPAISKNNVEWEAAAKAGIPILKRSEALGEISSAYQTLAVAGTHGKTTTSTMLAHLLNETGLDATAFLGGISRNLNSNFTFGKSELMVVEADEFDRSFLTLNPHRAMITSTDADHLDIYGTREEMWEGFRAFADQTEHLLVHFSLAEKPWGKAVKTYGIEEGDYRAENLTFGELSTTFDFVWEGKRLDGICLNMPGHHNVMNMTGAMALAIESGAPMEKLKSAAEGFKGIYRRFEVQHHSQELTYIDDYAHHPTEIEAAISTARNLFPTRQLIVVFQPHLYSRTQDFYLEFAKELEKADVTILMDIYPAREEPIPGVTSEMILKEMTKNTKALPKREMLLSTIDEYIQTPTVLLTLGAGNIDKEVEKITQYIKRSY